MTGATRVVRALERYYEASAEEVGPYLRREPATGGREALLLRQTEDTVEIALFFPERLLDAPWGSLTLDERCQLVEGASHFLVVCERARSERSTTKLELEIQAEVDKWLILSNGGRLSPEHDEALRHALFEDATFLDHAASTDGIRYRLAHSLADRFVHRLSSEYAQRGRYGELRNALARFFRMGQEEKLRAMAA